MPASLAFWMKTGPFSKEPATMMVAPVSERDLANARRKAATRAGLSMGRVTVLAMVNIFAPSVLAAVSYIVS